MQLKAHKSINVPHHNQHFLTKTELPV